MLHSCIKQLSEGLTQGPGLRTREQQVEWDKCAGDPAYWFDTYVRTFNPKLPSGKRWIPFKLFPKQREYLHWLRNRQAAREDGVVEKSRDVGMTWLNVGYLVWCWLFEADFKGAVGSRKEGLVDKHGDPDTILEKGRLIIDKLPAWMLPSGFKREEHLMFCRFINPENGSVITGEAGDNIGRGGRNSLYFVDEAAFLDRSDKVDNALSENADCKIYVSTPNGQGNSFYRKRFSGAYPVFTFRWYDDPRKDQAWYESRKAKYDPVTVAQEIDIDYTASVEGILIPAKWVEAAVNAKERLGIPDGTRVEAGGDIAAGGKNKTVFVAHRGPNVFHVAAWAESNTTVTADNLADESRKVGAVVLRYDSIGVGAGVRSTFDLREGLGFSPVAILSGESPSARRWPDGKTSKERFINLRAEMWWMLRTRFEKTYEMVEGIAQHPLDELISIPRNETLIAQISTPLYFRTETGKIKVESKDAMRKRDVASPDYADALVYSFADVEPSASYVHDSEITDLGADYPF